MSRTVIVSGETLGQLLEAHASMAAWYYELARVIREGGPIRTPDDATRRAFLARLATDFPEIAAHARAIDNPRVYVPPPPTVSAPSAPSE
ncbi:MAG: hypothetical protein IPG04_27750 [Polyangiaceae bacterium]|jgi:hypothetical protein|nr:hypothetical protein [Polyangiaceae bacterium]